MSRLRRGRRPQARSCPVAWPSIDHLMQADFAHVLPELAISEERFDLRNETDDSPNQFLIVRRRYLRPRQVSRREPLTPPPDLVHLVGVVQIMDPHVLRRNPADQLMLDPAERHDAQVQPEYGAPALVQLYLDQLEATRPLAPQSSERVGDTKLASCFLPSQGPSVKSPPLQLR